MVTQKDGGAELKVGGAAAPPTVQETPPLGLMLNFAKVGGSANPSKPHFLRPWKYLSSKIKLLNILLVHFPSKLRGHCPSTLKVGGADAPSAPCFYANVFWPKKRVKCYQIGIFSKKKLFDLFSKNGVKCYPIWILRPDLESSHHLGYLRPQVAMILTFWFFDG